MQKKKLGLALGSGAWRGLVHIGVIKSLLENKISIDYISGSSAGALVGGLYLALKDIYKVEKVVESLKFGDIFKVMWDKPLGRGAMICGQKFDRFFRNIVGNVKIEELETPLVVVCADIFKGKLVEIKKGDLVTALRASAAIPVVFRPVEIDGLTLVDGGAISPVPVESCRRLGAEKILGVSLYGGIFPVKRNKKPFTKFEMAKIARFLPLKSLADYDLAKADIKVEPKIVGEDYGLFANFVKNKKAIDCGATAMNEKMARLKNMIF